MLIYRQQCNICKNKSLTDFANIDHRFISRCNSCGYLFASSFDDMELSRHYKKSYYSSLNDPRIDQWIDNNTAVWKGLVNTVLCYKQSPHTLLDIGSGTGGFLLKFHSQNPHTKLFAIESSLEAKKNLSKKIPSLTFPVETADELEKLQDYYDVITLFQTLEHVYDPQKVCREVCKKLNPQGVCIITVPNRHSYNILLGGIKRGFCFTNATHLQFFTKYSINKLLSTAGFSIIKRVVRFGGSNITGFKKIPQYILRRFSLSSELRYVAMKS